jgi:hypothetical protein
MDHDRCDHYDDVRGIMDHDRDHYCDHWRRR